MAKNAIETVYRNPIMHRNQRFDRIFLQEDSPFTVAPRQRKRLRLACGCAGTTDAVANEVAVHNAVDKTVMQGKTARADAARD